MDRISLLGMDVISNMKELLVNWPIGSVTAIERIDSYSRRAYLVRTADNCCYILKERPNLSQTNQECVLLARLSEAGAPVALPVRSVGGAPYVSITDKVYCLYPQLPGEVIAEHYDGDSTARAEAFGQAIAFLHSCLRLRDDLSGYNDLNLVEQLRKWAIPCIRDHQTLFDADSLDRSWQEVEHELGLAYLELPKQLIHRDLHPANMLFDAGKLTGFLDFEMAVGGPRVFDLCYCGTSILVSGFPEPKKMQLWPALFCSLLKGYQEVCPLTRLEVSALYPMLQAIELLFVAFSLRTQDEDAARCNISLLRWLSAHREQIPAAN